LEFATFECLKDATFYTAPLVDAAACVVTVACLNFAFSHGIVG
jgi:hypothetical protein